MYVVRNGFRGRVVSCDLSALRAQAPSSKVGPQNISFTRNGADWSQPTISSRFVIFSVGNVQPYPYPYP